MVEREEELVLLEAREVGGLVEQRHLREAVGTHFQREIGHIVEAFLLARPELPGRAEPLHERGTRASARVARVVAQPTRRRASQLLFLRVFGPGFVVGGLALLLALLLTLTNLINHK